MAMVDLEYFNKPENLAALPTDPEILAKLMAGEQIELDAAGGSEDETPAGDDMDVAQPEQGEAAPQPAAGMAQAEGAAAAAPKDSTGKEQGPEGNQEAEPGEQAGERAGVATPSGKGVIPYAVLKDARAKAAQADQLASQLAEAQAQIQALQQGRGSAAAPTMQEFEASLAQLEQAASDLDPDENPQSHQIVTAVATALKSMRATVHALDARAAREDQQQQLTVQQRVQAEIDSIPTLSLWQSSQPEIFERAIDIDAALRALPAWANRPTLERFAEAMRQTVLAVPTAPVVQGDQFLLPASPSTNRDSKPDPKAVQVAAARALEAAAGKDSAVTLSDLRGGASGDVQGNNLSRLETASPQDIHGMMDQMNEQQLNEFLSGLGQPKARATLGGRARG